MKRLIAAALLLLSACDLRMSDNPPNESTAQMQDPRTGKIEYCKADWWLPDTTRVDACIDQHQRMGFVLLQKNY